MIEIRNALNIYSELNPQIDLVFIISEGNTGLAYSLLKQAYDNWFNLELNPDLQSVPIEDYLVDELNKANIFHEVFHKEKDR